jgi:anaerobic selenocysteine-containing dehydrogenase
VRELAAITLEESGQPALQELEARNWIDLQPDFETSHFIRGFGWPDGKYRFKADWPSTPFGNIGLQGPWRSMPTFPDHWDVLENADDAHPFRLATSPARSFLNSTFNETPSSRAREGRPEVLIHPQDAARLCVSDGDEVVLGNGRGQVRLHARHFEGLRPGVLISEGIWPNDAFADGKGINTLTGADSPAPFGGAAFHDNKVWLRRVESGAF